MITGISAVTLATHDMARAVGFYRLLDLPLAHGGEAASFTSFRIGGNFLNLILQPQERRWAWWGRLIFHHGDVDGLYRHADKYGYDNAGMVVDEVLIDGSHRLPSHRIWPMTEALKANIVEAAAGRERASERAVALANTLLGRFLTPEPAGGWIDRLDEHGRPATDVMPASTLYHVMCAIDELDRFAIAT